MAPPGRILNVCVNCEWSRLFHYPLQWEREFPTGEFADGQDLPLAVRGRVENGGVKSDTFFGLYLDEVD